jgi:CRP-like cAMP-binding protein
MDSLKKHTSKSISKGTILLHAGDICKAAYKVESGCLKSYVIDNTGKKHILQFAPEGWTISDLDSFINKKTSNIYIEALEDSNVSIITKSELKNFDPGNLLEMNHKLLNNLIATNKRLIGLLSATAEQRYIEFITIYPTLIQRLPLKLIASYLGITPEYLSEIRRKIAKK